ncbi:hypothetical protein KC19_12G124600 [Ceratodon purpureus]|uniref:DUF7748 domain-containing protein n=1 Tax=Ceratodon purpureus TaxID=3225 RepID=A0A8T0GAJ5_CERPU|nr:hypothetical protein KC19_12G124600 [Ceratodon purpureus]
MKPLKTVVINRSGTELELKEGNGGVYRKLTTLGNKDSAKYVISCDQNATYREYWVGTGVGDGADSITITSDDCAEYKTISIVNDPVDHAKLKLDTINRNVKVTAVVNQTGGDVKLEKDGAEPLVIRKDEKFVIKSDPEEAKNCNYMVVAEGGSRTPISTKEVSKAQIINVNMSGQTGDTVPKPTLDMVPRGLHVTEVTNKTSGPVKVKHCRGQGGSNESVDVATLQTNEKYTIQYDPKKGRNYCVEYSCSAAPGASSGSQAPNLKSLDVFSKDFAEFERIDVVEDSAGAEARLEKLEPRPEIATSTTSILSRVLRRIIPSWFE